MDTHCGVAIEGIQGELGWSSFGAREATAKLAYEHRAFDLPGDNLVRWVLEYPVYRERRTRWVKRTGQLRTKYVTKVTVSRGRPSPTFTQNPGRTYTQREAAGWAETAARKTTLQMYTKEKKKIYKEKCYDNSRGSGLLADARLGALRTRKWRSKFSVVESMVCTACGREEETADHVLLKCTALSPPPKAETLEEEALGFRWRSRRTQASTYTADDTTKGKAVLSAGAPRVTERWCDTDR